MTRRYATRFSTKGYETYPLTWPMPHKHTCIDCPSGCLFAQHALSPPYRCPPQMREGE